MPRHGRGHHNRRGRCNRPGGGRRHGSGHRRHSRSHSRSPGRNCGGRSPGRQQPSQPSCGRGASRLGLNLGFGNRPGFGLGFGRPGRCIGGRFSSHTIRYCIYGRGDTNHTTTTTTTIITGGGDVNINVDKDGDKDKDKELGQQDHQGSVYPTKPEEPEEPEVDEVAPEPDLKETLTVLNVDFNATANTKDHHTDQYEICSPYRPHQQLVVRRGQPFDIVLEFSKPYDEDKDDLRLVFETSEKPMSSKGTYIEFILSDDDLPKEWGAKIASNQGTTLKITVFTPPDCFVSMWEFRVDVVKKGEKTVDVYRYEHEDPIYIIFNPWCKDDTVYLEDENLLKEYVMNESGTIYVGNKSQISSRPWKFGQFESCVLDVAMYLLDGSDLNWAMRGNAIPVCRKISALVNSNDDGGVVVGNWSGEYYEGRSPLTWTGSVAILENYWASKHPVKYGQCWVFSGVCTTICRALGIPARSVTNFESAHDTDGSITCDYHFKANGEQDSDLNYDSIWNFHVWNEVWMARPDLPVGYGGWQVIDSTPQETSGDVFRCGPVPVSALKQGEVNLPFDGPFVFAEVNADKVFWSPNSITGKLECVHYDSRAIGKKISTKAPNSNQREDITNNYKPEEGSAAERAAVLKANLVGSNRKDIYKQTPLDVQFELSQNQENTWVGSNFEMSLKMKNNSSNERTVNGRIVVNTMYYTGVIADQLKSDPFQKLVLKPGEERSHTVVVTPAQYDGKLKDCCMLDVSVWAFVTETEQYFTAKEDYRLRKPHLTLKSASEVKLNQEFKVEVSFVNPLDSTMTNCSLEVDGVSRALTFPQGNVGPKGTFNATIPITPTKEGQHELIVIFNSMQLEDVNVSFPIYVRAN